MQPVESEARVGGTSPGVADHPVKQRQRVRVSPPALRHDACAIRTWFSVCGGSENDGWVVSLPDAPPLYTMLSRLGLALPESAAAKEVLVPPPPGEVNDRS
jgi:hypothetical protein